MTAQTAPACDATIAICTYNRLHTLPKTLDSLKMLRGPYSFEVLVVNGPSDDGTTEFLETRDDVRVLTNPEANLSISRNIAIGNAAGKYIAFIDDDAVPEADWLTLVIDRMEAEPDIAASGGFIRDANGIKFQAKYVYCDVFGTGYPCDNPDYATFLGREKRLYPSLTGTNVIFRMDDLMTVGGFDEVFAYFLDETDVNKRMDDAGMRAVVIPEAEIHHKYAPSHLRTAKNTARNMYPIARSVGYFAMQHGVPDVGWQATTERLQTFYSNEFKWKRETLAHGNIDKEQFQALLHQTRQGLMDGIDLSFDPVAPEAAPERRVVKHKAPGAPVVRQMRPADAALRLCMFSQDHGRKGFGGIGRWTNLVARGLAELGHEVTVIGDLEEKAPHEYCDFTDAGFWSHNISHYGREAGNEMDCLGLPPGLANVSKRKLAEMRRVMPRRRFQVASSPIWDVEGAAALGAGEIPTVLSLHTCAGLMLESKPEWRENEQYYTNHVLKVINAEIQALKRTPLILGNSTAIMKDISELYGMDLFDRPHVIVPHGIEDIDGHEGLLEARNAARAEAPADEPAPIRILFLGRLETRKGVAHLVPVLERLLADGHNIRADLVGGRTDPANFKLVSDLIAAYPEQVTWHGFLDDDDLDVLMRQADIFFGPSLYESFGLIYAEAMRYSIPCVAYAAGGVTEVVEDGVDGFLAELGDQKGLYDGLAQLITDAALRNRMSQAARANFVAKFHYSLMAERLAEVYQEVAAGTA